ncbi:GntR family transcriptional regulator [Arthrobacter sp. ERGS1:01]|uniref:cache domain-containing protein n=1 Tax=Arthrobacter sp. ERGS1:01 TaxID=1704044 RepID=UPI0006B5C93B|nr:cache domain-containing protein [Arthrobacter sp. ERGS1:01]ALE06320.1 GntR family transcriptional regulator [Arthrobacter sp. ERGS1:01]
MNQTTEVAQAADALTVWFGRVCTEVETLSRNVSTQLEGNPAGHSKADTTALAGLEASTREFLTRNAFAVGAGTFFAAESVEAGGPAWDWWSRKESGTIGRLDFDQTPGSDRYYDYEKLPFFSTAASTGKQTLWGPYVDYLGFEEYILTFAAPFSIHGKFAGVAGCDIRVKDLEPLIMPKLRVIPGDAALVNASNRVILGNSGKYLAGQRIKSVAPNQSLLTLDVPHLGLSLLHSV